MDSEFSNSKWAGLFVLAAVLWAVLVVATGNDLFPFPWLLSALFLGIGLRYALRALDES